VGKLKIPHFLLLMSAIDFASVADHQNAHHYFFVLNIADESVCPNSIFPTTKQFLSQWCPISTRIFFCGYFSPQIQHDLNLYLPIKLG